MWRSLFYAIGISLFAFGLQALVLDHVIVPKNSRVQNLIRKIMSDDAPRVVSNAVNPQIVAGGYDLQNGGNWNAQQAPTPQPNQSFGYNSGSRFGPSRFGPSQFSGPAYGTGYGGARISPDQAARRTFNSQPTQGTNAQLAGFRAGTTNVSAAQKPVVMQKFEIREWMPWSLLASGAIIFLYTHTVERRRFQD
jgi:hypothetical protein